MHVYNPRMDDVTDDYELRMRAGEEAGDILAEEARLDELGIGEPLNMMHSLYYESSGDAPEEVHPRIAALIAPANFNTTIRVYEQEN